MRAHAAFATAVLLTAGLTATAEAAPKKKAPPPACNLVKDASGDVSNDFEGVDVFPADQGLDVVGADVMTDTKNVTAVIRLAAEPGSATLYAKRYIFQVNVAGLANPLVLAGAVTPTGNVFSFGYYGPSTTGGNGYNYSRTAAVGKIEGKTITIGTTFANIASMTQLGTIKKGAKMSAMTVTANRRVPSYTGVSGTNLMADEAFGKATYLAGAASCLKAFTG